jgi:uncharacterized membrane protein YhaH (DUF805 family)
MGFGQAIKTCFRKYFVISGRAPRSEYWWFSLFIFLVGGPLVLIAFIAGVGALTTAITGTGSEAESAAGLAAGAAIVGLLAFIFFLAIIAPSITVLVRRFHDVGLSGWWVGGYAIANVLVSSVGLNRDSATTLLAIFGIILNLAALGSFIVTLLPSQSGTNKYGPNPLGAPSDFSSPPPPPGDYKQI